MRAVVEHVVALADAALLHQFATGYDLAGNRLRCRAMMRKSAPCQRLPSPRNGYCPRPPASGRQGRRRRHARNRRQKAAAEKRRERDASIRRAS